MQFYNNILVKITKDESVDKESKDLILVHVAEGDRAGSHMCFVLEKKNSFNRSRRKKKQSSRRKGDILDRVLPRRSKVNRCLLWSI